MGQIHVMSRPSSDKVRYRGGCHCGAVAYEVEGPIEHVEQCNCSICAKKGFLHLIVAADKFELLSGKDALTTYRFNTGAARHTFCATCGIHPFYVPRSDPDKIDVNVRCLDGVDLEAGSGGSIGTCAGKSLFCSGAAAGLNATCSE